MAESSFKVTTFVLIFYYAYVRSAHNLEYGDLGINCYHHKCSVAKFFGDCKCDSACRTYGDCCVDFQGQSGAQTATPTDMTCLYYGLYYIRGIYVVTTCSSNWKGPIQVKRKCEIYLDPSDLLNAAPLTSTSKSVTYKNRYCAECNNVDTNSLNVFHLTASCPEVWGLTEENIMENLSYNRQKKKWGINSNSGFKECEIGFELPDYLKRSVRFCEKNVVSKCARDWTRPDVKRACDEYMAVVYHGTRAYKNPHCAICNHVRTPDMSCYIDFSPLYQTPKPLLPELIRSRYIDISADDVECPDKYRYDPLLEKCAEVSCPIPGYVLKNKKCVPGG